jgi:hypothetical protein
MHEQMDAYGEGFATSGSETLSGGTLTITDYAITLDEEDGTVVALVPEITLQELGNGTVAVTMSPEYSLTGDFKPEYDPAITFEVTFTNQNLSTIVSGDTSAMTYLSQAASLSVDLTSLTVDGAPFEITAGITLSDLTSSTVIRPGDLEEYDYEFSVGSTDLLLDFDIPEEEGGGSVLFDLDIADMMASAAMALPADIEMLPEEEILTAGLAMDVTYGSGASSYTMDMDIEGDRVNAASSTSSTAFNMEVNKDRFALGLNATDGTMSMALPDLPFPVDASYANSGFAMSMPLSATDTDTDFGMSLDLTDLAISEQLWSIGDPAGQLPHDPITIAFDLTGMGRLFFDLSDPMQAMRIDQGEIPGALSSVSLNSLTVSALGALLTADGAFSFDNDNLSPQFGGMPQPEGSATARLVGLNALLDTLVGMGLLPEEEVMMPRMMMGMFATTVGDDELESTLEVNPEGHVIVNGQRMQ